MQNKQQQQKKKTDRCAQIKGVKDKNKQNDKGKGQCTKGNHMTIKIQCYCSRFIVTFWAHIE